MHDTQKAGPLKAFRMLGRAALLRCPNCGAGGLRTSGLGLRERCPSCGLRFDRGETDYFLGSYTINLFGALLVAVAIALAALWSGMPRGLLMVAGIAAIAGFAVWFHPFSRMVWLAADLLFRPASDQDFR